MMPFRFSLAQSNDLDSLKAEAVSSIDSLAKLNQEIMAKFKPMLEELYYDPDRFETYLDQLGIDYPQLTPTEIRRN